MFINKELTRIKDIIIKLYINRYKLINNIFNSDIKSGYRLISQNNKDYENIINNMKDLINIIENIKTNDLEIKSSINFIEYNYFYKKQLDNYIYKNKEKEIVESLFFGINNFIYYVLYIINKKEKERQKGLLDLLNTYKIIKHNLSIINLSLDNNLMKYYKQKNNINLDICKKILLDIKIKYNHKYKTTIEEIIENEQYYEKTEKIKFLDIVNINTRFLFKNIIIIDDTKKSSFLNILPESRNVNYRESNIIIKNIYINNPLVKKSSFFIYYYFYYNNDLMLYFIIIIFKQFLWLILKFFKFS